MAFIVFPGQRSATVGWGLLMLYDSIVFAAFFQIHILLSLFLPAAEQEVTVVSLRRFGSFLNYLK